MPFFLEHLYLVFNFTLKQHKELQGADVSLRFKKGLFFSMKANFSLWHLFQNKRKYIIKVNTNRHKLFSQLSREDLVGWFAHELAHITDYESMSNWKLVLFTLKYILNPWFRSRTEKRVNLIACQNGFTRELFGVWKKFLHIESIPEWYKKYIIKNYMPAWESLKEYAKEVDITKHEAMESVPEKNRLFFIKNI